MYRQRWTVKERFNRWWRIVKEDQSRDMFIYTMNRTFKIKSFGRSSRCLPFCNLLSRDNLYLAIRSASKKVHLIILPVSLKECSFDRILLFGFDAALWMQHNSLKTWILKGGRGEKQANVFRNRCFRKSRCFTACTSSLNSHKWAAASSN